MSRSPVTISETARPVLALALFAVAVLLVNPPDGWSDASPWWRELRVGAGYAGLPCFPGAAWFAASAMLNRARARAAAAWPLTEGTIVSSGVAPVYAGSGILLAAPKVTYRYAVAGTSYEIDGVQFGNAAYSSQERAQEIVDRYPPGRVVPVRYDPDDPAIATLELATGMANRQLWVSVLLLATPLVLGLLAAWSNMHGS